MVSRSGYRSLLGWAGVFCLAIFLGVGILGPPLMDVIPFRILILFGLPLAAVVLTTAAGFRGSKRWLVVAGIIACFTLFIFYRLLQPSCPSGAMFRAE